MAGTQSITITRCQPNIGAEIAGIDLTRPIEPKAADILRNALLEHQVIVLRGQDVTREQHREFARIFARDRDNPFTYQENQAQPVAGYPEILTVFADGKKKTAADVWHTDESFRPIPPAASVLRSRIIPSLGGDTLFSSGVDAYAGLPDEVKHKIRYLKSMHGPLYARQRRSYDSSFIDPEKVRKMQEDNPPFAQPVVRIHPETRKPVLFVNDGYNGPIVGMENEEGEKLLSYLMGQFQKPDYQMRVRWTVNTIVVWDNRSVQHYATANYNEPRQMERITVGGDAPAIGFADVEAEAPLREAATA